MFWDIPGKIKVVDAMLYLMANLFHWNIVCVV
jgi:hypothetical protein